jgi:hypothetical protein
MDVMMQRLKNSEGSDQRSFDLLCNMAELTSIFERKGSIAEFLGDVVEMVSQHMHSEVCSIYLYEHGRDRLILRATKGLNASMIDDLELEVGEGITGISFKEIRPHPGREGQPVALLQSRPRQRRREFRSVPCGADSKGRE